MRSRLLITAAAGYFFNIVFLNYAAEPSPPADRESLTPQGSNTQSVLAPCVNKVYQKFDSFLNHLVPENPKTQTLLFLIDPKDKKIRLWDSVNHLPELVKVAEEYGIFLEQKEAPESTREKWGELVITIKMLQIYAKDSEPDSKDIDVPAFLKWWNESTPKLKEKYKSLREELQNRFQGILNDLVDKCNRKLQELRVPEADEQLQRVRELSHEVYKEFYIKSLPFRVRDLMYNESVIALLEQFQIDLLHVEQQDDLSSIDSLISLDDSNMLDLLLKIHAPSSTVDPASTDIKKLKKMFSPGTSKMTMHTRLAYEYLKRSLDYWKILERDEGEDIRFLTIRFLQKILKEGESEDEDTSCRGHFRISDQKSIKWCLASNLARPQLLEGLQDAIRKNHKTYLNEIKTKMASSDKVTKEFKKDIKDCTSISAVQEMFAQKDSEELKEVLKEMGGLKSLQQDLQYLTDHGIHEIVDDKRISPRKSIRKPRNSKREREESLPDEEPLKMMPSGVEKEKVAHANPPHNYHDKFIQETFAENPMARDFFEKALPVNIRNLLDLNDFKSIKSILNGSDFSQARPNSLFKVKLKDDDSYIFLLIKHLTAQQPKAPKMICDYVEKVEETYEKELKELSCSYKPHVITIVLHTGDKKLNSDYLGQFNQYTGQILNFFSIRIAPPVIWVDILDSAVVERFEDFKTTAKIIRHVRLKESLDESREEILRKLNERGYKKYIESLKTYVLKNFSLEKDEKMLWKRAFKKLGLDESDCDSRDDDCPSPLLDVEETISQFRASLGPGSKATSSMMNDALSQALSQGHRKRPREEVTQVVAEDRSEEEDHTAVQQVQPEERPLSSELSAADTIKSFVDLCEAGELGKEKVLEEKIKQIEDTWLIRNKICKKNQYIFPIRPSCTESYSSSPRIVQQGVGKSTQELEAIFYQILNQSQVLDLVTNGAWGTNNCLFEAIAHFPEVIQEIVDFFGSQLSAQDIEETKKVRNDDRSYTEGGKLLRRIVCQGILDNMNKVLFEEIAVESRETGGAPQLTVLDIVQSIDNNQDPTDYIKNLRDGTQFIDEEISVIISMLIKRAIIILTEAEPSMLTSRILDSFLSRSQLEKPCIYLHNDSQSIGGATYSGAHYSGLKVVQHEEKRQQFTPQQDVI